MIGQTMIDVESGVRTRLSTFLAGALLLVLVVALGDVVVVIPMAALVAVTGALFLASSNDLHTQFDYAGDPENVVIDLSRASVWDASTVAALDAITHEYATRGKTIEIVGPTGHSAGRFERHTGQRAGTPRGASRERRVARWPINEG